MGGGVPGPQWVMLPWMQAVQGKHIMHGCGTKCTNRHSREHSYKKLEERLCRDLRMPQEAREAPVRRPYPSHGSQPQ